MTNKHSTCRGVSKLISVQDALNVNQLPSGSPDGGTPIITAVLNVNKSFASYPDIPNGQAVDKIKPQKLNQLWVLEKAPNVLDTYQCANIFRV